MRTTVFLPVMILLISFAIPHAQAQGRRAAILRTTIPGKDATLVSMLTAKLRGDGYLPTVIGIGDLCDASKLNRSTYDLLVLPDSSELPESSQGVIDSFLGEGGDIIALNAPIWQKPLIEVDGRWITRKEYRRSRSGVMPEHVLFGFGQEGISGWTRAIDDPEKPSIYEVVSSGPAVGHGALHMTGDASARNEYVFFSRHTACLCSRGDTDCVFRKGRRKCRAPPCGLD